MNVARTMAGLGKKVAVLDVDLRRSNIAAVFGLNSGRGTDFGITHYLAGKCEMSEILYLTNIPGFCIAPVGRAVANPLPLLNSSRFSRLLNELPAMFDYVLVDAPPVGVVIDAAEIAKSCDGTLFVVKYNEIHRRELVEAKQQIERTSCAILGAVINQVSFDSYSGKRYYHKSYHYYDSSNGKTQKKRSRPA
jgi:capsular exopolysaccharide synthesis family protein